MSEPQTGKRRMQGASLTPGETVDRVRKLYACCDGHGAHETVPRAGDQITAGHLLCVPRKNAKKNYCKVHVKPQPDQQGFPMDNRNHLDVFLIDDRLRYVF